MTDGEHLDALRSCLVHIFLAWCVCTIAIFCFKDEVFRLLLMPCDTDFCTYRWTERVMRIFDPSFAFDEWEIDLITTGLSSQFATHLKVSCILGLLASSPAIVVEVFRFVSPALYANERAMSGKVIASVSALFFMGIALSFFVIFPFAVRFLATYSVSEAVRGSVTLESYVDTFVSLTLLMGVVFQLPLLTLLLGKLGILTSELMAQYRKHAIIVLMIISAIITPPDILTLFLVTVPLYALYEVSIGILAARERQWRRE